MLLTDALTLPYGDDVCAGIVLTPADFARVAAMEIKYGETGKCGREIRLAQRKCAREMTAMRGARHEN